MCRREESLLHGVGNGSELSGMQCRTGRCASGSDQEALQADVLGEIGHATQLANRIKQLGGHVPGSLQLQFDQKTMQPPADTTDVVAVIKGVLDAENAAIEHYKKLIKLCDGEDYVTQDLAITIQADEEEHRQTFEGYLKEYQKG